MYVLKIKNGSSFEVQPRFFKKVGEGLLNNILFYEMSPIGKNHKFSLKINPITEEVLDTSYGNYYLKKISKVNFKDVCYLLSSHPILFIRALFNDKT